MVGDTTRALVDGTKSCRTQTNPSAQTKACCTKRILLVLTICFFLMTVGVLTVLLWREFIYHRPTETLKDKVLKRFPIYFRTQEQQESFVENLSNLDITGPILVNQSIDVVEYRYCSIFCSRGDKLVRRKRATYASGSIFHGCCVSNTYFASPDAKKNIFGVNKTLVHYRDMRQYFQATNCSRISGCTGCTCMQDRQVQTAVVLTAGLSAPDDIEDIEIDFFYFDGCCTCRNT